MPTSSSGGRSPNGQVDRLVGAAMHREVGLAVTVQIEPADAHRAVDGLLEIPVVTSRRRMTMRRG
jgi:hypothetical protein